MATAINDNDTWFFQVCQYSAAGSIMVTPMGQPHLLQQQQQR
jgi:hypothetical protein